MFVYTVHSLTACFFYHHDKLSILSSFFCQTFPSFYYKYNVIQNRFVGANIFRTKKTCSSIVVWYTSVHPIAVERRANLYLVLVRLVDYFCYLDYLCKVYWSKHSLQPCVYHVHKCLKPITSFDM